MGFLQTESVLQTKNLSEPAKKSIFCSPGPDPSCEIYHLKHGEIVSTAYIEYV